MIPKIIHYCWFGNKEKPESVKKCIETWRKKCPEFEIREWNETNYDISVSPFAVMAAKDEKWSFVTDYVRLDILYKYGGIYLDTDVEVLKDLLPLTKNDAFIGFEREDCVNDGQGFGCRQYFEIFREMLKEYDGLAEYIESPKLRTKTLLGHGLVLNGQYQVVDGVAVFPTDYFCPKNSFTGKTVVTCNTYSIHHFDGSWYTEKERRYISIRKKLCYLFGEKNGLSLFEKFMKIKDAVKKVAGKKKR